MLPFGPQLIGQTEKALNALLGQFLRESELSERLWVTLRIAAQTDAATADELAAAVSERAFFADAADLVTELGRRGLLAGVRPSPAGVALMAQVQAKVDGDDDAPPLWADLDAKDVEATARILNTVLERARHQLEASADHR